MAHELVCVRFALVPDERADGEAVPWRDHGVVQHRCFGSAPSPAARGGRHCFLSYQKLKNLFSHGDTEPSGG